MNEEAQVPTTFYDDVAEDMKDPAYRRSYLREVERLKREGGAV